MKQQFLTLRNVLAKLYNDQSSIRRVIDDAGIELSQIEFDSRIINTWHSVLTEAKNTNRMTALFAVVNSEYGDNQELQDIYKQYNQTIKQPSVEGEGNSQHTKGEHRMATAPLTINNAYALIVGVGKTKHDSRLSLPLTVSEAKAVRDVLIDPSYCAYPKQNVHTLYDEYAMRDSIMAELYWLQERASDATNATVLIYYSGHGWRGPNGEFGLIPSDIEISSDERLRETIIPAKELADAIADIHAARIFVLLDCCHAEGMNVKTHDSEELRNIMSTPSDDYLELTSKLQEGSGRVVICSCTQDQYSYFFQEDLEQGVGIFTRFLIEALKGANTQPEAEHVSIFDVIDHIRISVPRAVKERNGKVQTPHINYQGTDLAVAHFNPAAVEAAIEERLNIPAVRRLLRSLSDLELTSFCFDYYREVYQQFSDGMKLGQKQQTLLEYCENRNVTLQMLKNLKEFAPEQYEQHESRLYSSE